MMNIYGSYGDLQLVKAEIDSRFFGGHHPRRERRDSSLEVIRRSLARSRRQEQPGSDQY